MTERKGRGGKRRKGSTGGEKNGIERERRGGLKERREKSVEGESIGSSERRLLGKGPDRVRDERESGFREFGGTQTDGGSGERRRENKKKYP